MECKTVDELRAAVETKIEAAIDTYVGTENMQFELTRRQDQNGKQIADSGDWRLWIPAMRQSIEITMPLARLLEAWGWIWGYRKSGKKVVQLLTLTLDGRAAANNQCVCGHAKGNHSNYYMSEYWKERGQQRACNSTGCKCQGFHSAGLGG